MGRQLFSEKGCLACHSHQGTARVQDDIKLPTFAPAIAGEAQFGPNLSQLKAKLVRKSGDKEAERRLGRIWLRQWITDPHVHSPRSRMPVTHLTKEEAADVAAWLLDQQPGKDAFGEGWDGLSVSEPEYKEYENLARVYLNRLLPANYMEKFLKNQKLDHNVIRDLPADERFSPRLNPESLKYYLGKKAVSRRPLRLP